MRRTLTTTTTTAVLLAALAGCSNSNPTTSTSGAGKTSTPSSTSTSLTAATAFTQISAKVATAKLSGTVTAANDPDHLLGRPNQYTSKVTFSDSRIKASDVAGTSKGDVSRGGEIEVFADPAAAAARAKYIETVTKSISALAEYDYVHGTVLVRVSMLLTPTQAAGYKAASDGIG
ncbi:MULTISPECIES: hypothetical protein [unclassified Streptomyces]|uniref:hypothetical protein n=1 Tax=unclassified Streptomyces TaxID=2593676 RepID=UPI00224FEB99|nr:MULTISPECIES: hypothetical protein [unclassified Streptomyces]MCX5063763.1 hypothetical protein [Streptomyces sp. NBC_00452]MCX5294179.1 hypothetical protein [Streptomyces sp. NBC_00183]